MLIFMIELITEFIYVFYVSLKLMWHQSKSFQKKKKFKIHWI